jgi:hypothetical protein
MVVSDDTLVRAGGSLPRPGSVRVEELTDDSGDLPLIIGVNYRMSELTAAVGLSSARWTDHRPMQSHSARASGYRAL